MKTFLTLALLIFNFLCLAQNKEKGEAFIKLLFQEKKYEESYAYFDENFKSKVSLEQLIAIESQVQKKLGSLKEIFESINDKNSYFFYSEFEKAKLDVLINFNEKGKISGLFIEPHKTFSKEITIGKEYSINSNGIVLNGTILIPDANNLKKIVIFVHGSGPQDRDETIYGNKPFKDIAEGLFKKGIASYRYDKRTFSNPESFSEKSDINDEVTNDIVNVINFFKADSSYNDYEIIVLGHSLGAYLMPRIANSTNNIGKIVMLAGNARPFDVLINEQYDYLYSINPTPDLLTEVDKMKKQVSFLHKRKFKKDTPSSELPLNLTGYYWKSILKYNPKKEAKKLLLPMYVLQGESDYQVRMEDFELWKTILNKNVNAVFKSYFKLNHLFMKGETAKLSKPSDYQFDGKVDQEVIDDISQFIINK